jgi:hypothetical protein
VLGDAEIWPFVYAGRCCAASCCQLKPLRWLAGGLPVILPSNIIRRARGHQGSLGAHYAPAF